ncbi:MAG: MFS transporter [Thermomicrobia bacterium]|nr:MFS transporter [Thermomicrobia bacterium]
METTTEPSPTRFTGLWRHPDFLKLWAGQTVSLFGSRVGGFALTFVAVLTLHATPIQVALLSAAQYGPGLIVGLFAGVWVDRLRRRPVMIAVDIGRAAVLAIIPLAAALGRLSIALLFGVALLVSVLTVFFDVAYRSYLPSLVRRDALVEGNSKLQASAAGAEFGGWSIAGFLLPIFTIPGTILIDALSFLVSAASLATIRTDELMSAPAAEHVRTWREIGAGLRLVRDRPIFRALAYVTGVWNLFRSIIGATIILYVTRALHLSPAVQGVIWSIGGISAMIGALLAERVTRRWGVGPTMIGMLLLAVVTTIFIPLASGPLVWIVISLLIQQILGDGAATIYEINQMSLLQARTPDHLLGRLNASIRFIEWSAMLGGLLLGGLLGQTIGLRAALFVAVGGQLLAPILLALSPVRSLREQ